MTTDAFRPVFDPNPFNSVLATDKLRLASICTFVGYVGIFLGYTAIFLVSLLTVGFLEIRQANKSDFDALIAVLEQRDRYKDNHLDTALDQVRADLNAYKSWIVSLDCFDTDGTKVVTESGRAPEPGGPEASSTNPKTCAEIKATLERHANELSLTEDDVRFRSANLTFYYDQYEDGITQKTPQIIPALRLLDSNYPLLTLWARSPFELIEMFLLVCMGMLGGVISVMRCFVDPKLKNPAVAEFFYKPAAGAAISLGVYVLFRAAQIFLGVQSETGTGTVSTSIFLLAGLGLASGFCAADALAQIEVLAKRLLRSSEPDANSGGSANNPRGSQPDHGGGPNSGPAAAAATPG
jgi:hypothetical protein